MFEFTPTPRVKRSPFYDATVKHIFEFSILLPLLILYVSYAYRKYKTWKYQSSFFATTMWMTFITMSIITK